MSDVVRVDADDAAIGVVEKLAAHASPGILHRALSVFLLDRDGRVLLQQRAVEKHHFRGRWSNTCCSHPAPGEDVVAAGRRRLAEEMGVVEVPLTHVGTFIYRAVDEVTGLVEHELDHVLVGRFDGEPVPDPAEAADWRWADVAELRAGIVTHPERYSPWLAEALELAARSAQPL